MAKQTGLRDFSAALVQRIAEIIERHPGMKRTPLSRRICEALDWRGANGRLYPLRQDFRRVLAE